MEEIGKYVVDIDYDELGTNGLGAKPQQKLEAGNDS